MRKRSQLNWKSTESDLKSEIMLCVCLALSLLKQTHGWTGLEPLRPSDQSISSKANNWRGSTCSVVSAVFTYTQMVSLSSFVLHTHTRKHTHASLRQCLYVGKYYSMIPYAYFCHIFLLKILRPSCFFCPYLSHTFLLLSDYIYVVKWSSWLSWWCKSVFMSQWKRV